MKHEKAGLSSKVEELVENHEVLAVIVMMIIASVVLSHTFFSVFPLHTTTDELGAIVGAAALAGYDWSGVIDKSGYYGFGYYILFAPLFKLHLSPIIIYRIILIITRFLRGSIISGVAYYIGRHYYKFSSRVSLIILSFICTFPMHPLNDANIINDIVLDIFLWVIILAVCKIMEYIEESLRCIKWILIYFAFSFWTLFLHTRALAMVIASFLVLIMMSLYKRKKILLLGLLIIPIIVFSKMIINVYQGKIWTVSGEGLNNASVNIIGQIPISDPKTWEIWFDMIIGHVSVQTLLTGGLFLLAAIVVISYFGAIIMKKKMDRMCYINIVLAISILSMGAVFVAFMFSSWFKSMYETWDTAKSGQVYIYSYKAMCYVRYWNVFSTPFLFTGIYLLDKREYRKCVIKAIVAGIILFLGFVGKVLPIIQNHRDAASFLFTYMTNREEKVTSQFYYKCILICITFVAVAVIVYYSKAKNYWALVPIVILIVMGYHWANVNYNSKVTEQVSAMVLASYEEKCRLEEAGVNIGQIYAYDDRKTDMNWYIFSVLQFYFYDYRIEDEYPKEMEENDIIITCRRSSKIEADFPQLMCYQLDDNEVWYTNIKLIGYELQ